MTARELLNVTLSECDLHYRDVYRALVDHGTDPEVASGYALNEALSMMEAALREYHARGLWPKPDDEQVLPDVTIIVPRRP